MRTIVAIGCAIVGASLFLSLLSPSKKQSRHARKSGGPTRMPIRPRALLRKPM